MRKKWSAYNTRDISVTREMMTCMSINSRFSISMPKVTLLSVWSCVPVSPLINREEQKFRPISSRWFFIVRDLLRLVARDERPVLSRRVFTPSWTARFLRANRNRKKRTDALPLGFTSCNLGLSDAMTASTG